MIIDTILVFEGETLKCIRSFKVKIRFHSEVAQKMNKSWKSLMEFFSDSYEKLSIVLFSIFSKVLFPRKMAIFSSTCPAGKLKQTG